MRNSLLGKLSIYCYIQCDIVSIVKKIYFCVYKKKIFLYVEFPFAFYRNIDSNTCEYS